MASDAGKTAEFLALQRMRAKLVYDQSQDPAFRNFSRLLIKAPPSPPLLPLLCNMRTLLVVLITCSVVVLGLPVSRESLRCFCFSKDVREIHCKSVQPSLKTHKPLPSLRLMYS